MIRYNHKTLTCIPQITLANNVVLVFPPTLSVIVAQFRPAGVAVKFTVGAEVSRFTDTGVVGVRQIAGAPNTVVHFTPGGMAQQP